MISISALQQNLLLAAISPEDQQRLFRSLDLIHLQMGQCLHESGSTLQYAYFPVDCVVSLIYEDESGAATGLAIIGNEGLIGSDLFMGNECAPQRAMVLHTGFAYRLKAHLLKEEFMRAGELQQMLLRYTQALLIQIAQNAACNQHHTIDQQLCRWLLQILDRLSSNEMVMTHELLARLIGVRRESVTQAARDLQEDGLIVYRRGHITVVDRFGLVERACECYGVVKNETDRLLLGHACRTRPAHAAHRATPQRVA